MVWIAVLLYLGIVLVGLWILRIGYLIAFRGRLDLVRLEYGKSLAQAELIAQPYACMAGGLGFAWLLVAIAIPVFGLAFHTWPPYFGLIAAIGGLARHGIERRYRRLRQASPVGKRA